MIILRPPMRAVDIIIQKRDGLALTREAIDTFVDGVTDGTWPDYQASAFLMAVCLRGMQPEETLWLTEAMVRSGERVDLSDLGTLTVGKHSTGGVGDKVSIVLAPVVAACGGVVPKMSGRGLGHTGGTLDKLESIPGFRIGLSIPEFKSVLRDVGACMIGQTATLAPADKKLYALRDVTGTVESLPLIAASIMSKKLAEGCRALVLDVKCGDGAFMKDVAHARALAEAMVSIGTRAGVRTEAVITDMDTPLGEAVGNAVEIVECLDVLHGRGPADVRMVTRRLASRMLVLAGLQPDDETAAAAADQAIASGAALARFRRMVERQGGDPRVCDDPALLAVAPGLVRVTADRSGFVTAMRALAIGQASCLLGAGRDAVGDPVDHGVGIFVRAKPGAQVAAGDTLLELRHRDGRGLDAALSLCREAIAIGDEVPAHRAKILEEVR